MRGRCRGGCDTLASLGLWRERDCCSSCHEDAEYGDGTDYPLPAIYLPNGDWLAVCCRVQTGGPDTALILERLRERGW